MASSENLFSKLYIFAVLLINQLKLIEAVSVEPVCSKFSYDEQLLEKMVRIEFFVENMQKDVEKSVSNVMDLMTDIKGNNSELSDRFSEQQDKIDNLERQTDVLNNNKSTIFESTSMSLFFKNVFKSL
jgi:DNA-binding transcriptional regulator GbsR (MarR family)